MKLTPRDLDLLATLTCRAPVLRSAQAARLGWPPHVRRAPRKRLRRLARAGWLRPLVLNAHPPLTVQKPLAAWKPGKPAPDPERISRRARERWSEPARPTEVWVADRAAEALFGGAAARLDTLEHLDHDLQLAAVYVHYREHHPRLSAQWMSQHVLSQARLRIKAPAVLLREKDGRIRRVIEALGRDSPAEIERFHELCVEQALPYELW